MTPLPQPTASKLPRWRGFNLLEKYFAHSDAPFREEDFRWIADWGFDFVRLPMSYRCWTKDPEKWTQIDERVIAEIDRAVELGARFNVHVNLNLHRAPGYCVNHPPEPRDLWTDPEAQAACAHHWSMLARRYKHIDSRYISFDLLNEPPDIAEEKYVAVVKQLVSAIRAEDPNRLIIADGLGCGREPVHGLVELGVAQSTRGYEPMEISHWQANWVRNQEGWAAPAWPLETDDERAWDVDRLRRERIAPWKALERKGVGVHVGEFGAFNRSPHNVVLAWMRDQLALWKEAGWGWALWNLRGPFGVLDSGREDVAYEAFEGHRLDRPMLALLQSS